MQGLFYCSKAVAELEDLIGENSAEETNRLLNLAANEGLSNPEINKLSEQIVRTAHNCLSRHDPKDAIYLEAYLARIENWSLNNIAKQDPKEHLAEFTL